MQETFSRAEVERILANERWLRQYGRSKEAGHVLKGHYKLPDSDILDGSLERQQTQRAPSVTSWCSWGDMITAAHLVLNAPHTQAALHDLTKDHSRNSFRRAVIKFYNSDKRFWQRHVDEEKGRVRRSSFQDLVMVLDCIRGRGLPFDLQVHTFYGTEPPKKTNESPRTRSSNKHQRAMFVPRNSAVVYRKDVVEGEVHWVKISTFHASSKLLETTKDPRVDTFVTKRRPYQTLSWLVPEGDSVGEDAKMQRWAATRQGKTDVVKGRR